MIEVGKEYIFNYRQKCANETAGQTEMCINNSGMNCIVVDQTCSDVDGTMYEVESCTGDGFFAFESELDELKDRDIRCWK